jgi:hypothetical protein
MSTKQIKETRLRQLFPRALTAAIIRDRSPRVNVSTTANSLEFCRMDDHH